MSHVFHIFTVLQPISYIFDYFCVIFFNIFFDISFSFFKDDI